MATLLPGPFTLEMYHKLGELGIFDEDDRVELLDGQIVEMSPIGDAHAACVYRLTNLLARRTSGDVGVSTQSPVVLDPRWEPQPDIAVLRRPGGSGGRWLPTAREVVLVIEVADTSLDRDRDLKIPRYAHAGIAETWLVDVNAHAITCYRDPRADGYADVVVVRRGGTLRPLQLPDLEISAEQILGLE
jgi:Uma2 family endonuclease